MMFLAVNFLGRQQHFYVVTAQNILSLEINFSNELRVKLPKAPRKLKVTP